MKIHRHRWYHDRELWAAVMLLLAAVGCLATLLFAAFMRCGNNRSRQTAVGTPREPTLAVPLETSSARERSLMVPAGPGPRAESQEQGAESLKADG